MNPILTEREQMLITTMRNLLVTISNTQKDLASLQTKSSAYLDDAINMLEKLEQGQIILVPT